MGNIVYPAQVILLLSSCSNLTLNSFKFEPPLKIYILRTMLALHLLYPPSSSCFLTPSRAGDLLGCHSLLLSLSVGRVCLDLFSTPIHGSSSLTALSCFWHDTPIPGGLILSIFLPFLLHPHSKLTAFYLSFYISFHASFTNYHHLS